jgi:hypothetical protein
MRLRIAATTLLKAEFEFFVEFNPGAQQQDVTLER